EKGDSGLLVSSPTSLDNPAHALLMMMAKLIPKLSKWKDVKR
ncbi:hypothetical protein DBR06_SOUSAS31110006, partial [Sousa chinensis]